MTQHQRPLWQIHGLMILAAFLVSTSFTVGKAITHGLDPAILTLSRFLLASGIFAPFVARKYGLILPSAKALAGYALISFSITGFFWCMFTSLRFTSALNTSALFTLVPGISGIYAMLLLRERLGRYRLTALGICTIGAVWTVFRGNLQRVLSLDVNRGDILFLAGCFLMAFYTPLVKKFHRQESMAEMTLWILLTGSLWLMLFAAPNLAEIQLAEISPRVWLGIVYLAFFTTIVTFFLTQYATLHIGPTRVMAYSYLYPGLVLLINWATGVEIPTLRTLPGVVVVFLAMLVVQYGAGENNAS